MKKIVAVLWFVLVFFAGIFCGVTGTPPAELVGWIITGLWVGGLGEMTIWAVGIALMWVLMKVITHTWKTLILPIFARREVAKIVSSPLWLSGRISQEELVMHFPPEEHPLVAFILDPGQGSWLACPAP